MNLIRQIFRGGFLTVPYSVLAICESPNAAFLLARLIDRYEYFLQEGQIGENGWFYQTIEDMEQALFLTERCQRSLIRDLEAKGFVETKQIGLPAKRHFKINFDQIDLALHTHFSKKISRTDKNAELDPTKTQNIYIELNKEDHSNSKTRAREIQTESITKPPLPKGVHRFGTLPKSEILEAEDGLPEIELGAEKVDVLHMHAQKSGLEEKEAKILVDEVIEAYRLEAGANQAIHDKPYYAIRKWLNHAIKRFLSEKEHGTQIRFSKYNAKQPVKSNLGLENRPDPEPFSLEALDKFFGPVEA